MGTPETPMPQVRPLMPPPLFDAAHASGTPAGQAAQQPSHGAVGSAADAAVPAAMEDMQVGPQMLHHGGCGVSIPPLPPVSTFLWGCIDIGWDGRDRDRHCTQ